VFYENYGNFFFFRFRPNPNRFVNFRFSSFTILLKVMFASTTIRTLFIAGGAIGGGYLTVL